MFGYVRPPLAELGAEETERFRRIYCGLCHTLGRRHGSAARFILNYDFTFLAILLSEPREGEPERGRCLASPVRARTFQPPSPALEVAADESVILAYWQLRDGVADHGAAGAAPSRSSTAMLFSSHSPKAHSPSAKPTGLSPSQAASTTAPGWSSRAAKVSFFQQGEMQAAKIA